MVKPNRADLIAIAIPLALALFWRGVEVIPPPATSGEWAAWVQGVGTISAVGFSTWVGLMPMRLEQQHRVAQSLDFVRGVIDAAEQLVDTCEQVHGVAEIFTEPDPLNPDIGYWGLNALRFNSLERFLAIPVVSWPSSELFLAADDLWAAAKDFDELCGLYFGGTAAYRIATTSELNHRLNRLRHALKWLRICWP